MEGETKETMVVEEKKSDEANSVEEKMVETTIKSLGSGEFSAEDDSEEANDRKGKIDSILFDLDDGPASDLFQDDDNNDLSDDPFVEEILRSQQVPSSPDEEELPPRPPDEPSPPGPPPVRSVKFEGLDSLSSHHSSLEDNSPEALMDRLEKTQQNLTQAQIDLSGERAVRKRKEKNLVKLAKELKKRASESELQQVQIHKLANMVNDMEAKLNAADDASRSFHKELSDAHRKYRDAVKEHDKEIAQVKSDYEGTCTQLRRDILQANLEGDRLRTKLAAFEMKEKPEDSERIIERTLKSSATKKTTSGRKVGLSLAALFVVALIAVMVVLRPELFSMDAVCAPAMPGTYLMDDMTFEAPWWAPASAKEKAFSSICGKRTRTHLEMAGGKLSAHSMHGDDLGKLWRKNTNMAKISANEVVIFNKKGVATESIGAPWSLGSEKSNRY